MNSEFEDNKITQTESTEMQYTYGMDSDNGNVQESAESISGTVPEVQIDIEETPLLSYSMGHNQQENETEKFIPIPKTPEFTVTHRVTKKEKRKWPAVVALSLVAGLVFGAAFGVSSGLVTRYSLSKIKIPTTQKVTLNKADDSSVAGTSDVAMIADECMPSVVAITNRGVEDVMTFFGPYRQESTSSGSGIIIGKNETELLIVTNYHVVANSKELSVVFSSVESKLELQAQSDLEGKGVASEEYIPTATVKGYNSDKDLAVIAVKLEDIKKEVLEEIKIATIGNSSQLKPGDQVVAIGNSLGYGQSVTTGIISAVNRKITMESADGRGVVTNAFIQTDAAINSGNSGGALLDMEGRLIGINSVKIATTGVEGMGYAIPITDVESIIDELMVRKTRDVVDRDKQGFLGITGADVTADAAQTYDIPAGVYVQSVMEGLAAQKAGIEKGCIISEFDGFTITSMAQLQDRMQYYAAGESVKVKVQFPEGNGYKEKEITVKLSKRPEDE